MTQRVRCGTRRNGVQTVAFIAASPVAAIGRPMVAQKPKLGWCAGRSTRSSRLLEMVRSTDWPLMAKHVGERRSRQQLAVLGLVTPKLLFWGQRVMITTKGWDDFQGHWRARKKAGVVRGPDPDMSLTSGGHLKFWWRWKTGS